VCLACEFEGNKDALAEQLLQIETIRRRSKAMMQIKESDIKDMLETMATSLPDLDQDSLKDFLRGLVDRIVLDASSLACCKSSLKVGISWRPQGDSNPCTHRERVMS
jgi:hypothetical protein